MKRKITPAPLAHRPLHYTEDNIKRANKNSGLNQASDARWRRVVSMLVPSDLGKLRALLR